MKFKVPTNEDLHFELPFNTYGGLQDYLIEKSISTKKEITDYLYKLFENYTDEDYLIILTNIDKYTAWPNYASKIIIYSLLKNKPKEIIINGNELHVRKFNTLEEFIDKEFYDDIYDYLLEIINEDRRGDKYKDCIDEDDLNYSFENDNWTAIKIFKSLERFEFDFDSVKMIQEGINDITTTIVGTMKNMKMPEGVEIKY